MVKFAYQNIDYTGLHPLNLTWNLKNRVPKMILPLTKYYALAWDESTHKTGKRDAPEAYFLIFTYFHYLDERHWGLS
jgi:hypothetical protein